MKRLTNSRAIAASLIAPVIARKKSFDGHIPDLVASTNAASDKAFIRQLCYGCLRWLPQLDALLNHLLEKPLKAKDTDIRALLLLGLYQIQHLGTAPHAATSSTVQAAVQLGKPWAKGLINAVIRNVIRNGEKLQSHLWSQLSYRSAHPDWLALRFEQAWPDHYASIIDANNQPPPMTLRAVDRQRTQALLEQQNIGYCTGKVSEYALILEKPMAVDAIPGFPEGDVSIQDESAQLAAPLLQLEAGQRVLDACSAPGGKAIHCLQLQPDIELQAIDNSVERIERVKENLLRVQHSASVHCANACEPNSWFSGNSYDRILLDAPCSGTGVIRRHPDIKWLRTIDDINSFTQQQYQLLQQLWPLLQPQGLLLYVTCSIMPEENSQLIAQFASQFPDCEEVAIDTDWGIAQNFGRQILPSVDAGDGFYYALLKKV